MHTNNVKLKVLSLKTIPAPIGESAERPMKAAEANARNHRWEKIHLMKQILFCMAIAAVSFDCGAKLLINEVMQSNVDCIMDDLNQFPDSWVELYNSGDEEIDLSAYAIGDTQNPAEAWQLPSTSIPPHGYTLVYCDKESQGMHTHFRLESGKDCTLFLFQEGKIVDRLPDGMKKQPAPNIAFGRETDAGKEWGYQLNPTPGSPNSGGICTSTDLLPLPEFSNLGMVVDTMEPFSLELSLPEDSPEGAKIHYTLDGSEPTLESLLYENPIQIGGTTVVRAKTFCNGYLSPCSVAQSYIFHGRELTLPVVSILTDPKYLYSSDIGIMSSAVYADEKPNYNHDWRRPMNFEVFDGDYGKSCINQLGEARLAGGASRSYELKTLSIYANKRFGTKRFEHEFFPDQRPGLTQYKSLLLRNAGNDFYGLYLRDAIIQKHMAQYVDIDWQAYKPSIVYINGEYKGMLNIRERSNEDNIYTNYDGLEDIDMVENWGQLKQGSYKDFGDFINFFFESGHTYEEYEQRMEIQEFINVMILNLYFCNLDFPGNNIVHWKPQAEGGRWRVLVKDTDFGIGLGNRSPDYQIFKWLYDSSYDPSVNWANGSGHTCLFRHLMEDPDFHREFIDCMAIYMGDFLNFERVCETLDPMTDAIMTEILIHRALNNPQSRDYDIELEKAKEWLQYRTDHMYSQLGDFYGLGKPVKLKVISHKYDTVKDLTINGIKLSRNAFDGQFFPGREISLEGRGACKWIVRKKENDEISEDTYDTANLLYAIPEGAQEVEIIAQSEDTGIDEIGAGLGCGNQQYVPYNILGIPVDDSYRGFVIINCKKIFRH